MDERTLADRYRRLGDQLAGLIAAISNPISRMATAAALLHAKLPGISWIGWYLLDERGELVVGPYQGPLACLRLPAHTGVCWAAIDRGGCVIVPDVHAFPGHIACDARSRAEIVVPVRDRAGTIVAVLDVDSEQPGRFTDTDRAGLEAIAATIYG